jgi:predicted extracellular nuclease
VLLAHVKLFNIRIVMPHSHFSNRATVRNSSMNKRLYKVFSLIMLLALMLMALPMQSVQAATTVIAQWSFESPNTPADATDAATYPNAIAPAVGAGNAGGVHASAATDWTTPVGNGSADSFSTANWAVGDYYQFTVSTLNYTGIQVSWDQTSSNTGPRDFKLAYSTDGTSFTDFGSPYIVLANGTPNPAWNGTTSSSAYSFSRDLSAITALDNQANVYFRLIDTSTTSANGGTVATGGTNRVDNFTVSGTSMADAAPSVLSTTPANGATNVAVNTNITVNFSEAVDVVADAITVECPAGNVVASNAVVDNLASVVIDPASDLPSSTNCSINVSASGVTDEDTNDPPDSMLANFNATFTTAAPPSTSQVVISQIYGGAGCGTAGCSTYTNDYIELYNRSANTVNITGWSVQYASAAGTSWQVTALSGSIAPGQYYLVQEGGNANGVNPLPTPNATGSIAMSATAGKVSLVNNSTALSATTGCPIAAPIVDFVGYGATANCFEGGAPAPAPSTTTAIFRAANGATDTDNNAADFATGAPNPRNTPPPNPDLTINDVSLNEGDSGTSTFTFIVSLSSPANAGGVSFDIATADNTATVADNDYAANSLTGQTIAAGGSTYMFSVLVNGDANDEGADETFFVNVTNVTGATLVDGQGLGTIVNDDVDVCSQSFTPIYTIQGSGAATTIPGNVTTQGVVVGDFEGTASASGFYIQDQAGDGNPATSDGIFVFTGASNLVSLGEVVRVTGFARERFNQTTLNGSNSNTDPVTNIINCGTGTVPATDVSLPFASADFPERYEGMLVRFPQALVIAEYFNYDRFGEIVLAQPLAGEDRPFTGTAIDEPGAAANARTAANSLSRITLDDAQSAQNPPALRHPNGATFTLANKFRGGDTVQNAIGVLGFDFSLYRIIPTGPADYTAVNPRPAAPEEVGGTIRVAAMNTLNFFVTLDTTANDSGPGPCGANQNLDCRGADADQPLEFTRQRDKLLAALSGLDADIIGLNELESTPGAEPLDSIVSGMPGYDYIHTGPIGTDAIKVGMIYRPAVVTPIGAFKLLTSAVDPRFIDTKSRPSLAQTFEVNATGARFTVVVNHFKSKGSACDDVGDPDLGDGQGNCSQTRRAAAEALVDWLATDPTGSGDPDFLVVGDLNSYAKEDTLDEIQAGADDLASTSDDFTNLIADHQGPYAYSYTFDGQAGYLDHALANESLLPQITGAADWHINSDEPDVLDYDTSFKPAAQDALYEVNAYRTSDHDPVVVGLNLQVAPIANDQSVTTNEDTPVNIMLTATDGNNDPLSYTVLTQPSNGTLSGTAPNLTYTPNANFNGSDSFTFQVNDGTANSNIATVSITVTPVDDAPTIVVAAGGQCLADFRGLANLTVSDLDTATGSLTLSGSSSNTTLVPIANITFGGSGANRTVTIATAAGKSGSATVTIVVNDGTSTATVTIGVKAGTGNNDLLLGGNGANMLFGGNGNDILTGNNGIDLLCGGAGNDALTGGTGDDVLDSGAGNDILTGDNGNDVLSAGSGDDLLFGGNGNDSMSGGAGNDILTGGNGADAFDGGANLDLATDYNAGEGDTKTSIP